MPAAAVVGGKCNDPVSDLAQCSHTVRSQFFHAGRGNPGVRISAGHHHISGGNGVFDLIQHGLTGFRGGHGQALFSGNRILRIVDYKNLLIARHPVT